MALGICDGKRMHSAGVYMDDIKERWVNEWISFYNLASILPGKDHKPFTLGRIDWSFITPWYLTALPPPDSVNILYKASCEQ